MDLNFIWKAIVIVIGGVLILRLAGRKSISQLTVAQTVMMVAVGSLIIQPVGDRNIWITLLITLLLVLSLITIEFIVLKYDVLERFFYGKSIIVVEGGQLNERNLKKLRLTVDMLELRLRQESIENIKDLQWATIESNGKLGYLLKPEKKYATKEDIQILISMIEETFSLPTNHKKDSQQTQNNIFTEVKTRTHLSEPPDHLK
ncbi:DUF421 domain-containing protein [Salipaludibacillus sp. HK11]|uniref:DUF421 domain-containing protein n=1 Tax=Salipaludibacillus sp. HK11 TaxID=3394320 RepID=UPI0039FDE0AA